MIVVADTSPLNYLLQLGHIDLLPHFYGQVTIPRAVLDELLHATAPKKVRAWSLDPPHWLRVTTVKRHAEELPKILGAGEREAISLAMEEPTQILLIDDLAGRRFASSRNVPSTGTLNVLLQGALDGLLDFEHEFLRLKEIGFRCSKDLELLMLQRYVELSDGRS